MATGRKTTGLREQPNQPVKQSETEKITINLGPVDLGKSTCWCRKGSIPIAPT